MRTDGRQSVSEKRRVMPGHLAHCHPSQFSISAGVLQRRRETSGELRAAGRENGSSTTNCVSFQQPLIPCDTCHRLQICVQRRLFSTLLHRTAKRLPVLEHFSTGFAQVQMTSKFSQILATLLLSSQDPA